MLNLKDLQNPFRRPVATTVFLIGTAVALWLGIGATLLNYFGMYQLSSKSC